MYISFRKVRENMIKAVVFDLDHTLFDRYGTIKKIIDTVDSFDSPFKDSVTREDIFDTIKYAEKEYIYLSFLHVLNFLNQKGMFKDGINLDNYYNTYIKKIQV